MIASLSLRLANLRSSKNRATILRRSSRASTSSPPMALRDAGGGDDLVNDIGELTGGDSNRVEFLGGGESLGDRDRGGVAIGGGGEFRGGSDDELFGGGADGYGGSGDSGGDVLSEGFDGEGSEGLLNRTGADSGGDGGQLGGTGGGAKEVGGSEND
ncbi:glycine-rich cell wall structural protein 1.8-like [Cajanus cajan]|uniref:glycine-rich cell wall structural protein 1.8-like n=1 Tax=Cajanus cajan TaxID=3821 RepID=UPI00098DA65C|nr:glycine-rich cell wall structural protein 1.8-like [Cajanus cajan]